MYRLHTQYTIYIENIALKKEQKTLEVCFLFQGPVRDIPTYKVLQTIQMKLILLCVWAEPAVLGSAQTTLRCKYEI